MLDFGFSEILLTSAIALVVLGPERLPKVARQVGNWMGRARSMARQLSEQLEREVSAEEFLREQKKLKAPVTAEPRPIAPQTASVDPYAEMPPHDPIPPRSPLPPDVAAAAASPVAPANLSEAGASPVEPHAANDAPSAPIAISAPLAAAVTSRPDAVISPNE